jgi:hypothetical protein
MVDADATLKAAERVVGILQSHGISAVVIGAVALAAYKYVRFTEDLDLGIETDLPAMRALVTALRGEGFTAELRVPDGDDPLGGVIDITGPFGLIQIVNFGNSFPAAIRDALAGGEVLITPGGELRIIPLPQLIALKLYAGGSRSKSDIIEVLRRNPQADLVEIQATCRRYRLRGLPALLKELEE